MTTSTATSLYEIDPAHTSAQFSVRHLMISNVKGSFQNVTGSAVYDPASLAASKLDVTIAVQSIHTMEPQRDEHLRSADFFDAANHPSITFRSNRFSQSGGGLKITGDLTIRGVTKEVTLAVDPLEPAIKDPWGNTRIGASASTRVNRKDFGLNWNAALEFGGFAVGDEVKITIDAELIKKG